MAANTVYFAARYYGIGRMHRHAHCEELPEEHRRGEQGVRRRVCPDARRQPLPGQQEVQSHLDDPNPRRALQRLHLEMMEQDRGRPARRSGTVLPSVNPGAGRGATCMGGARANHTAANLGLVRRRAPRFQFH